MSPVALTRARMNEVPSISVASINIKNIVTNSIFLHALLKDNLFVFVQEHWLYNYQCIYAVRSEL